MEEFDKNIFWEMVKRDFHFPMREQTLDNISQYPVISQYLESIKEILYGDAERGLEQLCDIERNQFKRTDSYTSFEFKDVPARVVVLLKSSFYFRKGQAYSNIAGQENNAEKAFEQYFSYQVKAPYKVEDRINQKVYSFRRGNAYTISDLLNRTITVTSPLLMNDPFDTLLYAWLDYMNGKSGNTKTGDLFNKALRKYRIRSFCSSTKKSKPIENTLMWSHYADEHSGLCIEYSLSSHFQNKRMGDIGFTKLEKVEYLHAKERIDFSANQGEFDGRIALLCKSHEWKYEHEVRLITFLTDQEGDFCALPLDEDSYISAIYFGLKCPQEIVDAVEAIFSSDSRVKFYRICIDNKNIYKLKSQRIYPEIKRFGGEEI